MDFNDLQPARRSETPSEEKKGIETNKSPRKGPLDASLALASEYFCVATMMTRVADPVARKAELEKEAQEKLPKDVTTDKVRDLYVKDRLALEFPGTCPGLTDVERAELKKGLVLRANATFQGKAVQFDSRVEAILNVLRFYPDMPDDIRVLAEKREESRIKQQPNTRAPLNDDENAKLDAWLRNPKGTDADRNAQAKKFAKWAKLNRGEANLTETDDEKAEREYPGGSAYVRNLALKKYKGEASADELRYLAAWVAVPYSDKWRSDEWLAASAGMPGWKSPPAPDPDKFYESVRKAMSTANPSDNDRAIIKAWEIFSSNPRAWDLSVRSKTLAADEKKEFAAWFKYPNVWRLGASRARELEVFPTLTDDQRKERDRASNNAN